MKGRSPLDLVLVNARLATGEPRRPWATGLGIRGGALAVVGSSAEILKMVGPATRVIDARGVEIQLPEGVAIGSLIAVVTTADGVQVLSEEERS